MLMNYLSLTKNKKKALMLINIGIFLSIFGTTSAIVSFYIETKIDEKEFILTETQIEQRNNAKYINDVFERRNELNIMTQGEIDSTETLEFLAKTKLGTKIISEYDLYLPFIFYHQNSLDNNWYEEMFKDPTRSIIINFIKNYTKESDEETKRLYMKAYTDAEYSYSLIKDININAYQDKIFNSNIINLLREFKKNVDDDNANIEDHQWQYNDELYNQYKKVVYFYKSIDDLMGLIGEIFYTFEDKDLKKIDKLNKEIIDLSVLEKNTILYAFIFQLLIFIIIQFFEISSINLNYNKKK